MIKQTATLLFFIISTAFANPQTMRLDYYHTGNASQELFSVDRVVIEPLPWAGNPHKPIDDTNLGKYFFEVIDPESKKVLYSRGFASIYGEWEESDEAKTSNRTFQESLRFPAPEGKVEIVLKKRDAKNAFQKIWSVVIDPKDIYVDTSRPASPGTIMEIQKSGDTAVKVDFLILGDGYTTSELGKFQKDARRLAEILFAVSPFKERRSDFNVWALCPPAAESGISRPLTGLHRRSPVGSTYDALGAERYILTFENHVFRDIASFAPYDFVEILTNSRTYGGGGIFGLYGTVAADSLWSPYVFVHEFGHHFAGLADEYFSPGAVNISSSVEPWEPNVTRLADPKDLKWRDLIAADTPVPTPWEKEAYEKYLSDYQKRRQKIRSENRPEDEMDALFQEAKDTETKMLAAEKYFKRVGAFEGAMYEPKGYFRPQADCIMFTRNDVPFCAVCLRTIQQVIDLYSP